MKALRITLWVLLGIVVVVIAALAMFVATFDANRYKPEIQKLVFDQTGRTLQIQGNIQPCGPISGPSSDAQPSRTKTQAKHS
jgi:uncharacterized protein involved in outer membrane biogenesis